MKRIFLFLMLSPLLNTLLAQELLQINTITIKGNQKTKASILYRELSFELGELITLTTLNTKINTSKANLNNLKLFNFVDIKPKITQNNVEITIQVVEQWYIWPYPIFEISDRNFNTWWKEFQNSNYSDFSHLNYGIFLNWENFRGKNELLKLKIRRGFKEHYLLSYKAPYINTAKTIGIQSDIQLFRRKSTFYNTINNTLAYYKEEQGYTSKDYSLSTQINYRKQLHQTHSLTFGYYNSVISDTIILRNPNYLGNLTSKGYYFKLKYLSTYEKRDNTTYPLRGYAIALSASKYFKGTIDVSHYSLGLKAEKHLSLAKRLYFGSSFKAKVSPVKSHPYILQKALGFNNYVRGYEYYVIDGHHYWLTKSALKFGLVEKRTFNIPYIKMKQFNKSYYSIYLSIFSDMSYVRNPEFQANNPLNNSLIWGKGIGLDYLTYYDKLLRIEYSINHLGEKGVFLHFSNPF